MPTTFQHIPLLFTPAETAKITGVSERSQRNWRARGFLKPLPPGKHFRADVFDLSVLVVANLISDRLPVEKSVAWAHLCAKRVAYHALCQTSAWTDLHVGFDFPHFLRHQAGRAVADHFEETIRVIPAQYFFLWADGTELWDVDLNSAFENATPSQLRGAVLVLDLNHLGQELLDRQKPLMRLARTDTSLESGE
ncbi:helix-turn-helix domain-containing protein [Oceaniglobus roseus]|uniref:helix-turn-helix domain-containing protein n=1 Tax=Oceaniglobus roseus TaxID=1737570 RepID=UPI000C7EDD89|nr:helix-turn-helix domain-containing protein [Kandeliimicrobium roseum]